MTARNKVKKFRRTVRKQKSKPKLATPQLIVQEEKVPERINTVVTPILSVEEQPAVQPQAENIVPAQENPLEKSTAISSQTESQMPTSATSTPEKSDLVDTIFPAKAEEVNLAVNPPQKSSKVRILLLVAVFIAGAIIGSLTMYYVVIKPSGKAFFGEKPVPTVTPTQVLTPTEEPIDLGRYSIKVLNGSKIKGEAAKLEVNLETDGFKVLSAGNATSSAFAETMIRVKKNTDKTYLEKLKGFLAKSYVLAEIQELDGSEKTDVVIIIGSKLSP